MSAASDYLESKVLDHVLNSPTSAYTAPSTLYLGLFTNDSTNAATNLEAGTLTDEISGNNYSRVSVTFGNASTVGGTTSCTSDATVTFDPATGNWGTITHLAVLDASTAGNVLFWGALTASKTIESGDTMQFVSNNITISLA